MQIHSISVPKTAHYCTLGEPGPHIKYFWICCHGYGQLAKRFIRKFERIHQEDTLVVAPEGFSRFYWKDFTGDVVATHMSFPVSTSSKMSSHYQAKLRKSMCNQVNILQ